MNTIFLEIRYTLMEVIQSINNEELENSMAYVNTLDSLLKSIYIIEENYMKLAETNQTQQDELSTALKALSQYESVKEETEAEVTEELKGEENTEQLL